MIRGFAGAAVRHQARANGYSSASLRACVSAVKTGAAGFRKRAIERDEDHPVRTITDSCAFGSTAGPLKAVRMC